MLTTLSLQYKIFFDFYFGRGLFNCFTCTWLYRALCY